MYSLQTWYSNIYARMVELVDTRDLKSLALNRRAGSIPALRTRIDDYTRIYNGKIV